jgi:Cathepsin propeptide inhibitor domain (I29)
MKVLLVLTILVSLICVGFTDSNARFEEFKRSYGRKYKSAAETRKRFEIFDKKAELVEKHNRKFSAGQVTYKLGLNGLSDLTHAEVVQNYTGYVPPET